MANNALGVKVKGIPMPNNKDVEHYALALSGGGGTTVQCACGEIFNFSMDLQGHITWQLAKLKQQKGSKDE